MNEHIYYDMKCTNCNHEFTVKANIQRGFSDHEDVNCPECNTFVSEIRADNGYEIVKKRKVTVLYRKKGL